MSNPFKDHFSTQSSTYADFRPRYPAALYDCLSSLVPSSATVWDCATGTGQAANDLACRFHRVVATDASAKQIAAATPNPKIEFRVATAEQSGLPDRSVGLVTVAQALHWFDFERFFREVRRVLAPQGVIAAWAYGIQSLEDSRMNETILDFYSNVVGPYWPPERLLVEAGYRTIPFPFEELAQPIIQMQEEWTLEHLLGYFSSWSATVRFTEAKGYSPIENLRQKLAEPWGDPLQTRQVNWPLALRIGRV